MSTAQLKEAWMGLRADVDRIAREASVLKKAVQRLSGDEGYEALKRLEKDLERLGSVTLRTDGIVEQVQGALVPVKEWMDAEWFRRGIEFAEELLRFFQDRSIPMTGTPPILEAAPLRIEIELRKDQARLSYANEICRERLPLAPERIFREWQAVCRQLDRDLTPADVLFRELRVAYEEVRVARQVGANGRVRLPDVHYQIFVNRQSAFARQDPRKGKLKEYPRFQFAYDLARLLGSPEGLVRDGVRMTFHVAARTAADSRSTSMYMEDGRGGWTYFSDLQVESTGAHR
jgi:hypothetical protein